MQLNRFSQARETIQANIRREVSLQSQPGPDGIGLQPHTESIFEPQDAPGAPATVVMFHGYTACPMQYKELAARLHDAGLNAYVPRMPGHGCTDAEGNPTGSQIPNLRTAAEWNKFVQRTFMEAAELGAPVIAVGLSGGANVALKMAESCPDLKAAVAMAPYLGGDAPEGLIFRAADLANKATFGLAAHALEHIPYNKNQRTPEGGMPHTQGSLGQAMIMRHLGQDVQKLNCPVTVFNTAFDKLSGLKQTEALLERCATPYPIQWNCYGPKEGIPHPMISPMENPHAQRVQDAVFEAVMNYARAPQKS